MGTQIILAVVLLFIIISIITLALCIFAIFRYHYKNRESWLGQRLRQTFKIDPAFATYAVPTYTRENHDTELAPQREVTIAMAHPIYEEVEMMMQENSAYGTDVAIAPEIATERNAAYGHFGTSGGEEIASTSNDTISHQLLQHFETAMGHPINEDEYESRTDATSTTADSTVFPCPITMNLPGTRVETLV